MRKAIILIISILVIILGLFIIYNLLQSKKTNNIVETSSIINNYTTETNQLAVEDLGNELNNIITVNISNKAENNKQDNKKTKNEKNKTYKQVDETVYAIATVNIREKDNKESSIVTTLSLGDVLKRTAIGNNGWSKVEYKDKEGYIFTQYISKEKPPKKEEIPLEVDSERKIDPSKPMVALTFDDGPNPNSTPKILKTLEKYNCVATFFDLGKCMSKYPEITQKEEAIGCEVGSHTYAHKNLDNLSKEEILKDIKKAENIYKKTLGHNLSLVRPPYGNANSTVKLTLNYPLINWDVDTEDWKSKNKDSILAEIKKVGNLNGRIILMHSIYDSTADAVDKLVPQLLDQGYQLVTISELAKYKKVKLKTHTAYWGLK